MNSANFETWENRKTDPFMWPHAGISAKGTAAPGSAPDVIFWAHYLTKYILRTQLHWTKRDTISWPFNDIYKLDVLAPWKALLGSQPKARALLTLPGFKQATSKNPKWSSALRWTVVLQPWHDIIQAYTSILQWWCQQHRVCSLWVNSPLQPGKLALAAWQLVFGCVANASWRRTLGPFLRGHAMTKLSKGKKSAFKMLWCLRLEHLANSK